MGDGAGDGEQAEDDPEDEDERLFQLHVDLGTGLAFRELEWPIEAGTGTVSIGPSAALDVGLEMIYAPQGTFSLGFQMRYQSTVGAVIDEHQVAGIMRPMGVRGARYEFVLAPAVNLGDVFRLSLGVGYGLRGLRPEVHHLQTPGYTLAGPLARLGFAFAFGDAVTLTLAPEAQLLISVGEELTDAGVGDGGLSLGGQASLAVDINDLLSVFLAYREAHATVGGQDGFADTSDVERWVTIGLRGTL